MCNVRKTWYACGCGTAIRLSKCRGTRFKHARDKETGFTFRKVMCQPTSRLDVKSASICGPCRYEALRRFWDAVVAAAEEVVREDDRVGPSHGELEARLVGIREQRDRDEWRCRRDFPIYKKRAPGALTAMGQIVTQRSPLRRELFAEDIEDSNKGWGGMGEVSAGLPTFHTYFMDRYGWMGPQIDLAALMEGESDGNEAEEQIETSNAKEKDCTNEKSELRSEPKDVQVGQNEANQGAFSEANHIARFAVEPDAYRSAAAGDVHCACYGLEDKLAAEYTNHPRKIGLNEGEAVQFWVTIRGEEKNISSLG